jgi:hypothetical protein
MTTQRPFDAFYDQVLLDMDLQKVLAQIADREMFVQQVVSLGKTHGYIFDRETVLLAMQAQRRAWIERWIR